MRGGLMQRARCLRAAFNDPYSDEGLAGFALLAHLIHKLAPTE